MATTVEHSLSGALSSLAESSQSAISVLPSADSVLPPENGISLLDVKNELFLSYLQTLALRNLAVIRSVRKFLPDQKRNNDDSNHGDVRDKVIQSLIRQRVYLEKGVRPLEDRLKYTVDKTLRAATEEDRKEALAKTTAPATDKTAGDTDSDASSSSDSDSDDDDAGGRANLSAFSTTPAARTESRPSSTRAAPADGSTSTSGAYRPPRIAATSMPADFDRRTPRSREARPDRSRTLDEYVSTELSEAPAAQPSVGSMIAQGGRRQISARERAVQAERTEYEETHLTRLMEKKDKGARRRRDGGFGGEDWRGLGEGLERIDGLTKGTKRREREGALEKSRKRRATEDGQRGDGVQSGGVFDRRKKRMMKKLR